MTTLYSTVDNLRSVLSGTDGGVGTPAQLSDQQLTLALAAASTRISVAFGSVMDSSVPQAVPPDIFEPLTLDVAALFAWRTYLKGKELPNTHPAWLAYQDANNMLKEARAGTIRLDPAAAGGINEETGTVINRIPNIFNGNDSNTRLDRFSGYLESDVPLGQWAPRGDDSFMGGSVYQG